MKIKRKTEQLARDGDSNANRSNERIEENKKRKSKPEKTDLKK
ncbi:hypothetical protein [Methanimicrococcus hongohii]|nr:hypothetical protein [Methanimicrococcus sp. Hf6]